MTFFDLGKRLRQNHSIVLNAVGIMVQPIRSVKSFQTPMTPVFLVEQPWRIWLPFPPRHVLDPWDMSGTPRRPCFGTMNLHESPGPTERKKGLSWKVMLQAFENRVSLSLCTDAFFLAQDSGQSSKSPEGSQSCLCHVAVHLAWRTWILGIGCCHCVQIHTFYYQH